MSTTQPKTSKTNERLAAVAAKIIDAIESGDVGKWQRPWALMTKVASPMNAKTGHRYTAGNRFMLSIVAAVEGYAGPNLWATFNQWQEIGCQVRKGERSQAAVAIPRPGKRVEVKDNGDEVERTWVMFNWRPVFHVSQVDGAEAIVAKHSADTSTLSEPERFEAAETFVAATGADIRFGGDVAYYTPAHDFIGMPLRVAFKSAHDFYATELHELVHWSGGPNRLSRFAKIGEGQREYAAEELVAEMGAAMLCSDLGIDDEPRADHAQYLAHWASMLRDDAKALWTAASKAEKAVRYLYELAGETVDAIAADEAE